MINLVDRQTGEIIGSVVTNRSLTFDELCRLAGFEWMTLEDDDVETDGWYCGGILYEEQDIEIETE